MDGFSNRVEPAGSSHLGAAIRRRYTARMKPHKLLSLALACFWAMGAFAQYQWVDKDGRKVFSDRPPPLEVPQKNILKEPRPLPAARTAPAAAAPAAAAPAAAAPADAAADAAGTAPAQATPPATSGKDKALEEQKTKAEAQEAAKKKAEEAAKAAQAAKARADNCARARKTAQALQPGRLVGTTNAQGERGYMDDTTRAAELKRAEQIIQSDCK